MKKLALLLLVAFGTVNAATFNLFTPANGVLKGNSSTYVTTSATNADVKSLWTGTCDSTTYLRGDGSCQTPPGTGGGTVNSVGLSAPSIFAVGGTPVTTSGVLALTFATGQTANQILATPDGTTGAVGLRALVSGDLPTVPVAKGGSGAVTLTGLLKGNGTSAFTSGISSDVIGLWTGTCSSSTFLRGDGACASPGTGTVTSVAMTVPSGFSVTGSPVTTSGTLAISGTLNPAAGGTGVATLTGIAKGNGTAAFTVAASGDVIATWGGTCSASTYLRGDGTCATPASGGTTANPSATIGLTAVNGVAGTLMASDSAPALSQAIIPTWTGVHTFSHAGTAISVTNDVTAGTFTGSGASLTALNAGNVSTGILAGARGGTANGFMSFSGPATSAKTFTLPNATATILTDNAVVTVPQGGSGAATLTGYVKGNGTSAMTASATIPYSDLSGTPSIPTGANPSASVGLTAVNGSASTWMRSDGAPALSQSIAPTWTGHHTFNPSTSGGYVGFQVASVDYGSLGTDGGGAISGGAGTGFGFNAPAGRAFIATGGAARIEANTTGNVTIDAPSSGYGLTTNAATTQSGGLAITGNAGGAAAGASQWLIDNYAGAARGYSYGPNTSTNGTFEFHSVRSNGTNDITPIAINGTGNVTINAPSSGTGLTVNATNASTAALDIASGHLKIAGSAGTSGQVLTSGGSGAAPSWANAASYSSGTFTGTMSSSCVITGPTGTVSYSVVNGVATLSITSAITGTGTGTCLTMTGLPAAVTPANSHLTWSVVNNNSGTLSVGCVTARSNNTLTFGTGSSCDENGFSGAGTRGLPGAWTVSYPLN